MAQISVTDISGDNTNKIISGDKEVVGNQKERDNNKAVSAYDPHKKVKGVNTIDDGGKTRSIDNTEFLKTGSDGKVHSTNKVSGLLDSTTVKQTSKDSFKVSHKFNNINDSDYLRDLMSYNNIRQRRDIDLINHTYRFGVMNPYNTLSTGREYLFFTKPDLNILNYTFSETGVENINVNGLNNSLENIPFWKDLFENRKYLIKLLQNSYPGVNDPFNHLLQNQCTSNLEIQSLSSEMIETPQNMYGVGYSYRGSSESSDDNPSFSLEFKDSKYLDVYHYFKAYEEYETLKHHGYIAPRRGYMTNKIVHDQIAIYKFIVDEDMETIIYYGKMYGVVPVSLPRDVFGNPNFENGISYNIEFKAAFYEDMNPNIISDFNNLSYDWFVKAKHSIPIYNPTMDRVDTRGATAAYVMIDKSSARAKKSPTGQTLRLIWKGDK